MKVDIHAPPPDHPLAGCVESIFLVQARGEYSAQTIMPGGSAGILFNLGSRLDVSPLRGGSESIATGSSVMGGLPTAAYTIRAVDEVYVLGLTLKAHACSAVFHRPLTELTNRNVEGDLVLPGTGLLCEQLYHAASFEEQCRALLAWLAGGLGRAEHGALVHRASEALARAAEPHVGRVAKELGLSERHLRRVFLEHVGVTPSQWRQLARFRGALALMASRRTLSQVAHAAGYSDQAHLCRDFGTIAGMTPGEYRQRVGPVPGQIFAP